MAALAVGQPGLRRQIDEIGIDRNMCERSEAVFLPERRLGTRYP